MKTNKDIINVGGITGTREFFEDMYINKKIFIFKYRGVYQLSYSPNLKNGYYLNEFTYLRVSNGELPWTLRGKFLALDCKAANNLLGREVFV